MHTYTYYVTLYGYKGYNAPTVYHISHAPTPEHTICGSHKELGHIQSKFPLKKQASEGFIVCHTANIVYMA